MVAVIDQPIKLNHSKLSVVRIEKRPNYRELFDIAEALNPEGINIVCNTDIFYLPADIKRLKKVTWDNRVLALSRWDVQKKGNPILYTHPDSQDSWIFKGALKNVDCDFKIGIPGCDNKIAYEIDQAEYEISNPSVTIKSYHQHLTGLHNYIKDNKVIERIPPPYKLLPLCSFNGNKIKKILHICLMNKIEPLAMKRSLKKLGKYKCFNWIQERDKHGVEEMRKKLIELSEKFNPDITFMQIQGGGVVDAATASQLKGYIVNWTGDVRAPLPQWYKEIGKNVNITCFSNTTNVEEMKKEGYNVDFIQVAYDERIFTPKGIKWDVPEIVFMANNYNNLFPLSKLRYDIAHKLKGHFGQRFMLCGTGWDVDAVNLNLQLEKEAMVYRSCKIAINANHFDYKRFTSDRMFRIMGSGAFCLTKWYPDYEKDFIDGVHLRIFHNLDEMVYLINYYLEHEEERKKIAEAGYKYVRENFTWDSIIPHLKRMNQIQHVKTFIPSKPNPVNIQDATAPAPLQNDVPVIPDKTQSSAQDKNKAREARMIENEAALVYGGYSKKLSILIPSIEERNLSFMKLLATLVKQINQNGLGKEVEVLHIVDKGKEEEEYMSIGKKRNDLLRMACGEYIQWLDDDDGIHDQMIKLEVDAMNKNPGVDCITYDGWITIDGGEKQEYNFGIQYTENKCEDGIFQRMPGHIIPIRRDIAIKYKFKEFSSERDKGSDVHWSLDMVRDNAIKTSVHIPERLYHYKLRSKKDSPNIPDTPKLMKEPLLMQNQEGAFNQDSFIEKEFIKLRDKFGLKNCIELGTCLGYTTQWLAKQFQTVRTVEINEEFLNLARTNRLNGIGNVQTYLGDSTKRLKEMLTGFGDDTLIFIDSHWGAVAPAPKELEIIAKKGIKPVIVIHDFKVPNHPELGFDLHDEKPFNYNWLKPYFQKIYGKNGYGYHYNKEAEGAKRGVIFVYPKKHRIEYTKKNKWVEGIKDVELVSGYSQMGEESIIKYIFSKIGVTYKYFVDFGAGDGKNLSNTLALQERRWKGLLMDGDNRGNKEVKQEFITKDNIIRLFKKYKVPQKFDFLSIDLDGNDYYVLLTLLMEYSPRVICAEFNGTIGQGVSKTIKYNSKHTWRENDYYGFSFEAGKKLAEQMGYVLIFQLGSTNMFFIRKDIIGGSFDFGIDYEPQQYHPHVSEGEWVNV